MASLFNAHVLMVFWAFRLLQNVGAINVRLVNGTSANDGRVEVQYNSSTEWGTLCDDNYGTADAAVICRQLGFSNVIAVPISEGYYGAGDGPILIDELNCTGSESNLDQCDMRTFGETNCDHIEDAGVMCLTNNPGAATDVRIANGLIQSQGLVQVQYQGVWGTVCSSDWLENESNADVVCKQLGYTGGRGLKWLYYGGGPIWMDEVECLGNETDLVDCPFGGWSEHDCDRWTGAGIFCEDSTLINYNVRLVEGDSSNEGRVEVQYGGVWGTVCDDYWSQESAEVVCRMLGFNTSSNETIAHDGAYFGEGSGDIFMDDVQCNGDETNIGHCLHITAGMADCSHSEDAGVYCSPGPQNINVRLVNGTSANEGRVEVQYNPSTEWGTLCDDNYGTADAAVICRQLGFSNVIAVPIIEGYYGAGAGPILIDELNCTGSESNLDQCGMRTFGETNCEHREDAGVMCLTYNPGAATDVRIVNGLIPSQGLVQVQYQGVWGTVCHNDWLENNDSNADVVCKQLGYTGGRGLEYLYYEGGPIWMDDVECLGNETDLVDCPFDGWSEHDCDRWTGAGVFCEDSTLINYNVRLVGGNSSNEGRVEVQYGGAWGTVCDDYWSKESAEVVCRMLGFITSSNETIAHDGAYFGEGSGDIFMDEVQCNGDETNIGHCLHITAGMNDCTHSEDAGVYCSPDLIPTTTGLPGSDLEYSCYPNGTVEVTNPNPGTFTDVMAVQNQGLSSASKCTVSASGSTVLITDCSQDLTITVYFSDRVGGSDDVFVGEVDLSYDIRCNDIQDSGVHRIVSNQLANTLEPTTQDSVTPSFVISSALRTGSQTGPEVDSATVADELWWTIDIPSDYNGQPTCTAYSGSTNSGTPTQTLVSDGCTTDLDLVKGNFENIDTGAVPLVKRIWTTLRVFRFYNSQDVYIECSVKLCPSSSSSCDVNCGGRKKRSIAKDTDASELTMVTGQTLHIVPDFGISAASAIGGCMSLIAMATTAWLTLMSKL